MCTDKRHGDLLYIPRAIGTAGPLLYALWKRANDDRRFAAFRLTVASPRGNHGPGTVPRGLRTYASSLGIDPMPVWLTVHEAAIGYPTIARTVYRSAVVARSLGLSGTQVREMVILVVGAAIDRGIVRGRDHRVLLRMLPHTVDAILDAMSGSTPGHLPGTKLPGTRIVPL